MFKGRTPVNHSTFGVMIMSSGIKQRLSGVVLVSSEKLLTDMVECYI